MSIKPTIRQKLYLFIKSYSETHKVTLTNIHLWADHNHISRGEMGYELQLLKEIGAIYYDKKYGWRAK
jgi:hypothetical protein